MKYKWWLKKTDFPKNRGKVFSTFSCGGGSSMGYKLAGFDVVGALDIDPRMMDVYKANHKPKYSFVESITTFKNAELPEELFDLDILDGSPPCSSFSFAGVRERDWGKKKKFKEGQAEQVLDRLFFDFIDLAKRLQPKVVVAENVTGLLVGKAVAYVREIYHEFDEAGYYCQHFVLDASNMGVPQSRERVFFICLRKDLADEFMVSQDMFTRVPQIKMNFSEKEIPFGKIKTKDKNRRALSPNGTKMWCESDNMGRYDKRSQGGKKIGYFYKCMDWRVCGTIMASGSVYAVEDSPHWINKKEMCMVGTFPQDFDFGAVPYQNIIGMSVPPVMMAKVAEQIWIQWLKKLQG